MARLVLRCVVLFVVFLCADMHAHCKGTHSAATAGSKFFLEYHFTPSTKPGMGGAGTTVTITDFNVHFVKDYPAGKEVNKKLLITEADRQMLIDHIQQSRLFTLESSYTKENCYDGSVESLKVEIGTESKVVYMYCTSQEAVTSIKDMVFQTIGMES